MLLCKFRWKLHEFLSSNVSLQRHHSWSVAPLLAGHHLVPSADIEMHRKMNPRPDAFEGNYFLLPRTEHKQEHAAGVCACLNQREPHRDQITAQDTTQSPNSADTSTSTICMFSLYNFEE